MTVFACLRWSTTTKVAATVSTAVTAPKATCNTGDHDEGTDDPRDACGITNNKQSKSYMGERLGGPTSCSR
jgi:hypothetical protein